MFDTNPTVTNMKVAEYRALCVRRELGESCYFRSNDDDRCEQHTSDDGQSACNVKMICNLNNCWTISPCFASIIFFQTFI